MLVFRFLVGLLMSVKSLSGPDYTPQLKQLMQQVGLPSFAALSRTTGLSRTQIGWLRQGRVQDLRVGQMLQLSQCMNVSVHWLLDTFSSDLSLETLEPEKTDCSSRNSSANLRKDAHPFLADLHPVQHQKELEILKSEYHRLHAQFQDQKTHLRQEYQQSTLQILEPLLLQWPTAAYAARKNPEAPAVKILPLLRPLERLLTSWGVVPIGEVGTETVYDPQWHQLMPDGGQQLQRGERVRVRYVGYRQGEQLLYRAKVSPL